MPDDFKYTAARRAGFPLVCFTADSNLTPQLVRQKLIAEYRLAKAGPLPGRWGKCSTGKTNILLLAELAQAGIITQNERQDQISAEASAAHEVAAG